jgi:LL-diaminopimelate aminotransferase
VFSTSISLAGGKAVPLPLRPENGFAPDPDELKGLIKAHQPKYLILNFPSNPTSAFCTRERMEALVQLARDNNVIVLHDNAYSEIYFDPNNKPLSILQIPGAKDVAIELHSFSKSYNMTGWRIGFAVGNEQLVAGLLRAKTNIDSGPLLSVQQACPFILENAERFTAPIREVYQQRRDVVCKGLDEMGIEYLKPQGAMFVWAKVPSNMGSMELKAPHSRARLSGHARSRLWRGRRGVLPPGVDRRDSANRAGIVLAEDVSSKRVAANPQLYLRHVDWLWIG